MIGAAAAAATGLRPGTPVFGGAGDQAAAAVGTGTLAEGRVSISLGTSGVVFAPSDRPRTDPGGRLHAFCHALPDRWHLMGVMLSAGGSLRWLRDTIAPGTSYEALVEPAAAVAPGSDGLIFLPYLTGERTPHPDPEARGAFVGLTTRHTRAHLVRAVLEGVALGLRDNLELLRAAGLPAATETRLTGGGAASPLWRQILADCLGADMVTVSTDEGAAAGAALLAAVGARAFATVEDACAAAVRETGRARPGPARQVYAGLHAQFTALYPLLASPFRELGTLERRPHGV